MPPNRIITIWPVCIVTPTKARCLTLSCNRWHIKQYCQRAKDDPGFYHLKAARRSIFIITSCSALWLTTSSSLSTPEPKKTSGATWKQTARVIRPWLVFRLRLYCRNSLHLVESGRADFLRNFIIFIKHYTIEYYICYLSGIFSSGCQLGAGKPEFSSEKPTRFMKYKADSNQQQILYYSP